MADKLINLDEYYYHIESTVVNNILHPYYKHTVSLAKQYDQIISGNDSDKLLKKFVRREDDDMFKQRVTLTQNITPSVSETIMNPFFKVGRVNNIVKKIDFENNQDFEGKKAKLEDSLKKYYGEKTLDDYLSVNFVNLSFLDPNAYIITEFDGIEIAENGKVEGTPIPRPFVAYSDMVINYHYDNNVLEWLIVRMKKDDGLFTYTIYLREYSIVFNQIKPLETIKNSKVGEYTDFTINEENITIFRADEKRYFIVEEYNHKSKEVPAKVVGYKPDLITKGATFINPLHAAMPYFLKTIKTVSEFDLTMALHAFPQKFQYVNRCAGTTKEPCNEGKLPTGDNCTMCGGTGYAIHSSAQDAITLRLPKKNEEMVDLDKLVVYKYPPIDLLTFQDDFIKELKKEVKEAVFNSETFNRNTAMVTATESNISLESVYDTLYPFAVKYSEMYMHIAKVTANYHDLNGVVILHKFPRDFKFKGLTTLLSELKSANESDAPGYVRTELSNDIAAIQFEDKPEELKRIIVKQKFYPFPDKTDVEVIYIISNGLTTEYNKILWGNFDAIFTELENEAAATDNYFYDYNYLKQKELLDKKVQEYIDKIGSEKPAQASLFNQVQ